MVDISGMGYGNPACQCSRGQPADTVCVCVCVSLCMCVMQMTKKERDDPRKEVRSLNVKFITRGVRLAKNDFGSVFGFAKTAVFGSVSVLLN